MLAAAGCNSSRFSREEGAPESPRFVSRSEEDEMRGGMFRAGKRDEDEEDEAEAGTAETRFFGKQVSRSALALSATVVEC